MELKEVKNQETDDYERDKRPEIEKLNRKEITITESRKKTETKKKA